MECDEYKLLIGKRISVKGKSVNATIRYIGEIDGKQGIWYGIEWDDKSEGTNDGTLGDRVYFSTTQTRSGSFIRPHLAKFGVSFEEAINQKYQFNYCNEGYNNVFVEPLLHNFKCADISDLSDVCLDNWPVDRIDSPLTISRAFHNLKSLSLYNCLINDIEPILTLVGNLPMLRILDLTKLRFDDQSLLKHQEIQNIQKITNKIEQLNLDETKLSWIAIIQMCQRSPYLSLLSCCRNEIEFLDADYPDMMKQRLEQLFLHNNCLTRWNDIKKLNDLTNLKVLHLSNNAFSEIVISDGLFTNLRELNISDCPISEWIHILELDKLPNLTALIARLPYLDGNVFDGIVARLPKLEKLNMSIVDKRQRTEAELRLLKENHDLQDLTIIRLRKKYEYVSHGDEGDEIIETKFLSLSVCIEENGGLHYGDEANAHSNTIQIKVPKTMSVGMFIKVIQKKIQKIRIQFPSKFEIWYIMDHGRAIINCMNLSLASYSIENDSKILIKPKN
ncbi:hypothetical protein GJ496_004053 [Pomphorhynchus laevis]|nr:hypothetical protein GJ496_004053 [Pomphorhynchus laevis]